MDAKLPAASRDWFLPRGSLQPGGDGWWGLGGGLLEYLPQEIFGFLVPKPPVAGVEGRVEAGAPVPGGSTLQAAWTLRWVLLRPPWPSPWGGPAPRPSHSPPELPPSDWEPSSHPPFVLEPKETYLGTVVLFSHFLMSQSLQLFHHFSPV